MDRERVTAACAVLADEYGRRIAGEFAHRPFDREKLDDFTKKARQLGQVFDLGCGPGHIGRYLHDLVTLLRDPTDSEV